MSCAGLALVLALVLALGQRCGLPNLVESTLTLKASGGVNARLKVPALIGGMVAGADSMNDVDLLRHGGMNRLFTGVRAPSTLGTFLRSFTFGHVRQLDAVAARFPARLARATPAPIKPPTSVWTTPSGRFTATPSRASVRLHRREGAQRAAGHPQHPDRGAGDRRDPAASGLGQQRPRRGPAVADALVTARGSSRSRSSSATSPRSSPAGTASRASSGRPEVENEIAEVVDFLRGSEKYRVGARAPKGVLLAGAPGTGKTLLARATAGEPGVPFLSASASEFIEMVVGVGASRVCELFGEARKVAPRSSS